MTVPDGTKKTPDEKFRYSLDVVLLLLIASVFLAARASGAQGETICMLLDSFSGYILVIAGVIICLSGCGINIAALSLTAGVAGVIFSIGCQSIVADILAGILMAFGGDVHVGDFLLYNGSPVNIQDINIRTIKLKGYFQFCS